MLHISSVDANTFRMYGNDLAVVPDLYPKEYQASAVKAPGEDEPRISIKHLNLGDRIVNLKKFDELELNGVAYTNSQDFVAAFNTMIAKAIGSGTLSLSTYRIPQVQIDGLTEDTFTLPFLVKEAGIFYVINGKFVYTLSDGITSITNGSSDSELIFADAILDENVVVVFYEPA